MTTVYDVDANELIEKAAEELKNVSEIKPPAWALFAKTGMFKERPPTRSDWWFIRCAAVLRSVYTRGPVGTSKLKIKFGGKKNMGVSPSHFFKGSGSIIRKALQQLEKAGLTAQVTKKGHKGRMVTPKGRAFLDKIASKMVLAGKKAEPKVEKPQVEEKKAEPKADKPKAEEKPAPEQKAEAKQRKPKAKKEEKNEQS